MIYTAWLISVQAQSTVFIRINILLANLYAQQLMQEIYDVSYYINYLCQLFISFLKSLHNRFCMLESKLAKYDS